MDLVVDANILFAALIRKSKTAELLFKDKFHLFAPEYLLDEFVEHREEIVRKSDRPSEEFDKFLDIMKKRITFCPFDDFKHYMKRASEISPDHDDEEYIALALSMKADIWSNDKSLREIKEIDVFSTTDLVNFLQE